MKKLVVVLTTKLSIVLVLPGAWGENHLLEKSVAQGLVIAQNAPTGERTMPIQPPKIRVAALDLQVANAAGNPVEAVRVAIQKLAMARGKVIWDINIFTEPKIPEIMESYHAMQAEFFKQVEQFKGTLYIGFPGDHTEAQASQIFLETAKRANVNMTEVPPYVQFGSIAIAGHKDILAMVKIPGSGKLLPMALKVMGKDWPDDSKLVTIPLEPPLKGLIIDHNRDTFKKYIDDHGNPAGPAISIGNIGNPIDDADITIFAFHLPGRDNIYIPNYGTAPGYFAMILSLLTAQRL